jgi:hypothetical protein
LCPPVLGVYYLDMTTNQASQLAAGPRLSGRLIETLEIPCPRCEAAGSVTNGGATPRLHSLGEQRRAEEPNLPFCHVHGYIAD